MAVKKNDLMTRLLDRAMGYTVEEIVEEYGGDDKGGELLKKKITTKPIPPDINALKTYLELNRKNTEFENMSDEELEKEKLRLINSITKQTNVV